MMKWFYSRLNKKEKTWMKEQKVSISKHQNKKAFKNIEQLYIINNKKISKKLSIKLCNI